MMEINKLSGMIVDTAYHIHKELGPGLLEKVYEVILAHKLRSLGLRVDQQRPVPIKFEGIVFHEGFKADLIVEEKIVVETKSVENMPIVYGKQLLTYLRMLDFRLGLLINFGTAYFRDGVVRVVNKLEE